MSGGQEVKSLAEINFMLIDLMTLIQLRRVSFCNHVHHLSDLSAISHGPISAANTWPEASFLSFQSPYNILFPLRSVSQTREAQTFAL